MPFIISGFVFTLLVAIGQAIATNIDQSIVVRRMEQLGATQAPAPILAPDVSSVLAGTHEGAISNISSGSFSAQRMTKLMPSKPQTLAISCRSVTRARVPRGITA